MVQLICDSVLVRSLHTNLTLDIFSFSFPVQNCSFVGVSSYVVMETPETLFSVSSGDDLSCQMSHQQ